MKLYHGSNIIIDTPDLSKSKPYKDFGRGFYLSADFQQALDRARQITDILNEGEATVNTFEWDKESALTDKSLNIKIFEDYCEEWAFFVLKNRDRKIIHPVHTFDIVIGPIADDSVTYQLRRFSQGDISMLRLIEELKFSRGLTIQYFFGSEKSLTYLKKS